MQSRPIKPYSFDWWRKDLSWRGRKIDVSADAKVCQEHGAIRLDEQIARLQVTLYVR